MKKFLFSVAAIALAAFSVNAQVLSLPANGQYCKTSESEVQGDFTFFGGQKSDNSYMTIDVDGNNKTSAFDGASLTNRVKLGGAGYASSTGFVMTPTQRYVKLTIPAGKALTLDALSSSGSAATPTSPARVLFVTDGTNKLAEVSTDGSAMVYVQTPVMSASTDVYIFADNGVNIYRFQLTDTGATDIANNYAADCGEPTGFFNLLGQKLGAEPAKGAFIATFENCPAQKFVK